MCKAQGCTLCRDATAGSPPQVRKALRRAIPLLAVPALAIFSGVLVIARAIPPKRRSETGQSDQPLAGG
ncbi:hypothetical protein ACPOL_5674 [Acidisarcina polymorpha]|uniref:Uncharacterized protein n=2 Tax=Acidisarcina polymorpha TaxID=2211140 RepID=A0A2Z5G7G9_9BACT|nr:hypothetical protein ACPOL_5674 [Acidisarcina polymorpha]